jgi:mRNA interferase MazF
MVDFNPARGSEQAGIRPALVIQNDVGNSSERYPNTIVLAVRTKGRPVPFHVRLEPSRSNGLRESSFVKCEQILTLAKVRLLRRPLGRVTAAQLRRIEAAVLLSIGIGLGA